MEQTRIMVYKMYSVVPGGLGASIICWLAFHDPLIWILFSLLMVLLTLAVVGAVIVDSKSE